MTNKKNETNIIILSVVLLISISASMLSSFLYEKQVKELRMTSEIQGVQLYQLTSQPVNEDFTSWQKQRAQEELSLCEKERDRFRDMRNEYQELLNLTQ